MNIIEAIKDRNIFEPFLHYRGGLETWQPWMVALRVVYGLPVAQLRSLKLVRQCTGRDPQKLPPTGFDTALFLTGRRSGKSRIAAVAGAYEAVLAGRHTGLARGEIGLVAVISPTRFQSRIVRNYLRAIFDTPLLTNEVTRETADGFALNNGVQIQIMTGDWRSVRGFSLLAAIIDEAAFFGLDAESKVRSDTELIRAIRPSLATTGGKLIGISTPYAKKGWCYQQWKRNHGNDGGRGLVWNCPSRTMNPTLPQSVVGAALAEDLQAAKSEYLGEFREDIGEYLPRAVIEKEVVPGRRELLPRPDIRYTAFADLSGGRADDAAVAIAHKRDRTVIIDFAKRYRPPFSPQDICREMSDEIKRYGIRRITGDNYAAEFVARAFEGNGIRYQKADKPKSILYAELLPRLCSGEIELPDDEVLISQLAGLERRVRSGGRDIIDHPPGAHDDLANVIAGVATVAATRRLRVGAF